MVDVGHILDGRYRLLRVIGSGGMGTVYEALQLSLDRRVAVKVLRHELGGQGDARARFEREAQIVAKIANDHIAQVYDVAFTDWGDLYMVMELLSGADLRQELALRGALPLGEAVRYIRQACSGIGMAHRAGVAHRDLKPENLFLAEVGEERRVKILDFGIAKMLADSSALITASSTAVGTPAYMSPEQVDAASELDGRADIWALGVILYELVSGAGPFERRSPAAVLKAVLFEEPPPLKLVCPGIPDGLSDLVARAMSKSPTDRPGTAGELAEALAPFATMERRFASLQPRVPGGAPTVKVLGEQHEGSGRGSSVAKEPMPAVRLGQRRWARSGIGWLIGLGALGAVGLSWQLMALLGGATVQVNEGSRAVGSAMSGDVSSAAASQGTTSTDTSSGLGRGGLVPFSTTSSETLGAPAASAPPVLSSPVASPPSKIGGGHSPTRATTSSTAVSTATVLPPALQNQRSGGGRLDAPLHL